MTATSLLPLILCITSPPITTTSILSLLITHQYSPYHYNITTPLLQHHYFPYHYNITTPPRLPWHLEWGHGVNWWKSYLSSNGVEVAYRESRVPSWIGRRDMNKSKGRKGSPYLGSLVLLLRTIGAIPNLWWRVQIAWCCQFRRVWSIVPMIRRVYTGRQLSRGLNLCQFWQRGYVVPRLPVQRDLFERILFIWVESGRWWCSNVSWFKVRVWRVHGWFCSEFGVCVVIDIESVTEALGLFCSAPDVKCWDGSARRCWTISCWWWRCWWWGWAYWVDGSLCDQLLAKLYGRWRNRLNGWDLGSKWYFGIDRRITTWCVMDVRKHVGGAVVR